MPGVRILMYHSISETPGDPWSLSPAAFAQQMQALAGTRVLSLAEALDSFDRWKIRTNGVVITFDDAFVDFFTHALPVLKQHGFPATVFVPTGLVGKTAVWHSFDKTKQLMDWDMLKAIRTQGIDIGSHTVSHPRLPGCDPMKLESELQDSLDHLKSQLDHVVPVLAYPFGDAGKREMAAAQKAGYRAALGIHHRFGNLPWTNRYRLERVAVTSTPVTSTHGR